MLLHESTGAFIWPKEPCTFPSNGRSCYCLHFTADAPAPLPTTSDEQRASLVSAPAHCPRLFSFSSRRLSHPHAALMLLPAGQQSSLSDGSGGFLKWFSKTIVKRSDQYGEEQADFEFDRLRRPKRWDVTARVPAGMIKCCYSKTKEKHEGPSRMSSLFVLDSLLSSVSRISYLINNLHGAHAITGERSPSIESLQQKQFVYKLHGN